MSGFPTQLADALRDRYVLERELGRGGMATVYLAHDVKHDRPVALKVLHTDRARALSPDRFRREIRFAARLQHPHILTVLDSGESAGRVWFTMPFVEGESLRGRLHHERRLPLVDALRITEEAAQGLQYAHEHGVLHRDIKPENILLTKDGSTLVADFGIARALKDGEHLTEDGMVMGTPAYMSPEQARGDPTLDARTDVYSLGCVLYEMLAGETPFPGPTAQVVITKWLLGPVPSVRSARPDVPEAVERALQRALAPAAEDRFASANDLSRALRAGATASRASPPQTPRRRLPVVAPRRLAAGVAATVLVLAALVLWPRGYHATGDPRHSLIVFPFENRTGDAEYDWLVDAAMNAMGLTMAHWQDLRVYDDERTRSLLRRARMAPGGVLDFAEAQRLAQQARVGTLVLGEVRREGGELVFEAKVHDVASGERLNTEIVRTPLTGDPRSAFDSLSARVLRVSGAETGEQPGVVAQTTRSLEAYRAYLAGTAFLQRFELDSAERYLGWAIALDSNFALAYLELGNAEGWREGGGNIARRRTLLAEAQAHGADLPPRYRLLVQSYLAFEAQQYRLARAITERLIARDPEDVEAWYQLGEATFHDGADQFPHPDTLGNFGRALQVFQHVLALDSGYTVAYQHITDILESCARPDASWICLPDSTVYGAPGELTARYGASGVRAARDRAQAQVGAVIRAWTAVTPASPHVREWAIQVLGHLGMWREAQIQIDALRALSGPLSASAEAVEIWILVARQHYVEAADTLSAVLARVSDTELVRAEFPLDVLVATGRLREADAVTQRLFAALAARMRARVVASLTYGDLRSIVSVAAPGAMAALRPGTPFSVLRTYRQAVLDSLRLVVRADPTRLHPLRDLMAGWFWPALFATLDTTFFVVPADPPFYLQSRETEAVLAAVAALQRGDTSAARRAAHAAFPAARSRWATTDLRDRAEVFEVLYLWGRLFTALGDRLQAVEAYTLLDSVPPRAQEQSLQVGSWAERGALYQALGDTARAIEMYEKFIDVWREADPELQPLVARARRAVAALKGEVGRKPQ